MGGIDRRRPAGSSCCKEEREIDEEELEDKDSWIGTRFHFLLDPDHSPSLVIVIQAGK